MNTACTSCAGFLFNDGLSRLTGAFVVLLSFISFIYSLGSIKERKFQYYFWFLITAAASCAVVFAKSIIVLIVLWGFLGLTLFRMINLYPSDASAAASKKTFIIVGGSDGLLLLGFILYIYLTRRCFILNTSLAGSPLLITGGLSLAAFLLIAVGCFAKAGCMPFHTWIPEAAEHAPLPVVAFLPASLDKLLGIYLLARVVQDTFVLNTAAKVILLVLGAVTILFAVMMALIQHNVKRLLGYHAVSQVGYMVLGIGCASSIGIAAGLFHMINHAIYKSCLFMGAGNVEERCGTSQIAELGGLGRFMPITFVTMIIAAFSISGIPPLNGFVSKWMVYQSLIDFFNASGSLRVRLVVMFCLLTALIGSGLTLASFIKVLSGVFLGTPGKKVEEAGFLRYFPMIVLALFCVVFGVFFRITALQYLKAAVGTIHLKGLWQPVSATLLIGAGFLLGLFMYYLSRDKAARKSPTYVGGEFIEREDVKPEDFYETVRTFPLLGEAYRYAQKGWFDIYEGGKSLVFSCAGLLRYLHNGILPTYLVWCLLGVMGLFVVFLR